MAEIVQESSSAKKKRDEYRNAWKKKQREMKANKMKLRETFPKILDIIIKPGDVDMRTFCGTEDELEYHIEQLYANDGR
jgi:hypothetical protein